MIVQIGPFASLVEIRGALALLVAKFGTSDDRRSPSNGG